MRTLHSALQQHSLRRFLFFDFRFVLERGFHLLDDSFERDFVGDRDVGENLAVQSDAGGFQAFGETAVGQALARGRRR